MTFTELRNLIITHINDATLKGMSIEEVYGVLSSIDPEIRVALLTSQRVAKEKEEALKGDV